MVEGLRKEGGLRVRTTADEDADRPPLDRAAAERLVRNGDVPVAVVLPKGLGAAFGQTGFGRRATDFAARGSRPIRLPPTWSEGFCRR